MLHSYSHNAAAAVATYRIKIESIEKLIARYDRRLANSFEAEWLTFARLLGNLSMTKSGLWNPARGVASKVADPTMARLLEVEERDRVVTWSQLFWHRFNADLNLSYT